MTAGAVEALASAAMTRRLCADSHAPLAVAVSGGGDSVALLEFAAVWAGRANRRLRVLHVDHGLSDESQGWARAVEAHARRLGAACERLRWEGSKPATGLAAAARAARHALVAEAARRAGARVVLMGHTADDAAEGERMRAEGVSLGRIQAWAPSPAWPEGRGVMLLRPLLEIARADLRDWLRARGVFWVEDPANADPRFTRARVRAAGLWPPLPPPAPPIPEGVIEDGGWGLLRVRRSALAALSRPQAARALSAALVCASGGARPPRGGPLRRLLEEAGEGRLFSATLAGARVEAAADTLTIGREPGRTGPRPLYAGSETHVIWDGRIELEPPSHGAPEPLGRRLGRLSPAQAAMVRRLPPPFRPTLPVWAAADGTVELLEGRWLVYERLRAALGLIAHESDIGG